MNFFHAVNACVSAPAPASERIIQTNLLHEYDPGKYTSGSTLVDQQGNRNLTINGATHQTSTSGLAGMMIFRNGNNNTIGFRIEDANGQFMGINYSHIPATSTWYYYAMTWQNSPNEVKIYLYNSSGLFHTDTNTSFSGRDMSLTRTGIKTVVGGDTYPVDGLIGEAHTYSSKLSQSDITANYNSTKARYGY